MTPEINNETQHGSISKRTAEERNSTDYRKLKQWEGLETHVLPKGIAINHMQTQDCSKVKGPKLDFGSKTLPVLLIWTWI